jgi:hypothetical protein
MDGLTGRLVDGKDIQKAIIDFSNSPEYRQLSAFYRQKSLFEALNFRGVEHTPIRNPTQQLHSLALEPARVPRTGPSGNSEVFWMSVG